MWPRVFKEAPEREFEPIDGDPPAAEDLNATRMLGGRGRVGGVERSIYGIGV